jgi:uncharacterized protein
MLVLCSWILVVPSSRAQDTGGFPGFLQHLFGFGSKQPTPPKANPQASPRRTTRRQDFVSPSATRALSGKAHVEPTFFITVIGDNFAVSAAHGLAEAFADKPDISVKDVVRDLSGLTRDDYYDWPKAARELVAGKQRIDVAVIMMGVNDLQPLKDGDATLDPLSEKWLALYGQRVESLIAPFRDKQIPVFWVGLPPMPDDKLNTEAIALNEIYREHVERAGGKYIDTWDGFADQNGQYNAFGADVEGQRGRLRSGPNGLYFTKAGARKLAQFLEMDIRRAYDKGKAQSDIAALPPDIEQQADDINAEIRREMGADKLGNGLRSALKPETGPILSLTARPTAANAALVGTLRDGTALGGNEDRNVSPGRSAEPQVGRADDFSWPKP